MAKITYIKIAGKNYPMSFSLGASKKITEKYGSTKKMNELLSGGDDFKKIDMVTDLLSLLISQGCAYKNYFEKDIPTSDDDPVIDGKWTPLAREVIEIAVGIEDVEEITAKIEECIGAGSKKEVELRSEGKNAKSAQG